MEPGTILALAVVAVLAGLSIRSLVKGRKSGKCSCGGDCSKCGGCH